jgi:importin subunit beta-1
MESFSPFLYNALEHQEEAGLCSMAIGLVSDIARALNDKVQPYCDTFMNLLLNILRVCPTSCLNIISNHFANILQLDFHQPAQARHLGDFRRYRPGYRNPSLR